VEPVDEESKVESVPASATAVVRLVSAVAAGSDRNRQYVKPVSGLTMTIWSCEMSDPSPMGFSGCV
jgi:hypothetical protein